MHPTCIWRPGGGEVGLVNLFEFRQDQITGVRKKGESVGYIAWRCFRIPVRLAISAEHRLVTDGQTDTRQQRVA